MGGQIEKVFDIENRLEQGNENEITIRIKDIKEKIPKYSSGNGHSCLRDGSNNGKQIGYLMDKYQVKKQYKNSNGNNSELVAITLKIKAK